MIVQPEANTDERWSRSYLLQINYLLHINVTAFKELVRSYKEEEYSN